MKGNKGDWKSAFVTGIILAAGTSRRLSGYSSKPLLEFEGEPLICRVVNQALASRLKELVVVLGYRSQEVRNVLTQTGIVIVKNIDYAKGQSSSVRAGLTNVSSSAEAALFIPVDQPLLVPKVINKLISAYESSGANVVVPAYRERWGSPVLFDRSLFEELSKISGDIGGRQILENHRSDVFLVHLENEGPLQDIDTLEDYQQLLNLSKKQK